MTRQHPSIFSSSILFVCAALFFFTAPLLDRSAPLASAAPIIFESSTLGPIITNDNSKILGTYIYVHQSYGVRITVPQNMQTVTVGGHFGSLSSGGGGRITASFYELPFENATPGYDGSSAGSPTPSKLLSTSSADIALPGDSDSGVLELSLSQLLKKDKFYALVFDSVTGIDENNQFDAFGVGIVMENNTNNGAQHYYVRNGENWNAHSDRKDGQPYQTDHTNPHFFVTAVVPEPTSGLLAIFSFAGIVLRRGRRSRSR